MKINFKTILIIFLIAMLGGATGTYGVLQIEKNKGLKTKPQTSSETVQQVTYEKVTSGSYSKAINNALDTVVEITTVAVNTSYDFFGYDHTSKEKYMGSGVLITTDGYIVTNNHVVQNAEEINVKLKNEEIYPATIIGTDTKTDLALIKIDASDLKYTRLLDSDQVILGQEVIAIGNALGEGISCSNGIISAINKEVVIENYSMTLFQTNAAINSGNSGGGLFDMGGNLLGIVNAKLSNNNSVFFSTTNATIEGMGYAIPSNTVKKIVDELMNNGYVKNRPALGVKIYTGAYNANYNIEGLVISDVIEGGAGDKGGLKANDIIKAIDGVKVYEFAELSKILDEHEIGDVVELDILRENKELKIKITLQESVQ